MSVFGTEGWGFESLRVHRMRKLLIVLALFLFIGLAGFLAIGRKPPIVTVSPSPTAATTPTSTVGWESYKSPRFGYTFSYPKEWYFLPFDEANPDILQGSHSLLNYSYNGIEAYMNHGMVDWQKFLGDKIAIKIDLIGEEVSPKDREYLVEKYYSEATKQPVSILQIGKYETTQYDSSEVVGENIVRSFVAFPDNKTAIMLNVYIYNSPSQVRIQDTNEWKELVSIATTFK